MTANDAKNLANQYHGSIKHPDLSEIMTYIVQYARKGYTRVNLGIDSRSEKSSTIMNDLRELGYRVETMEASPQSEFDTIMILDWSGE